MKAFDRIIFISISLGVWALLILQMVPEPIMGDYSIRNCGSVLKPCQVTTGMYRNQTDAFPPVHWSFEISPGLSSGERALPVVLKRNRGPTNFICTSESMTVSASWPAEETEASPVPVFSHPPAAAEPASCSHSASQMRQGSGRPDPVFHSSDGYWCTQSLECLSSSGGQLFLLSTEGKILHRNDLGCVSIPAPADSPWAYWIRLPSTYLFRRGRQGKKQNLICLVFQLRVYHFHRLPSMQTLGWLPVSYTHLTLPTSDLV